MFKLTKINLKTFQLMKKRFSSHVVFLLLQWNGGCGGDGDEQSQMNEDARISYVCIKKISEQSSRERAEEKERRLDAFSK